MATSSIFESFDIMDKKTADAFVAAIESSEQKKVNMSTCNVSNRNCLTDQKQIKQFFAKGKAVH